MKLFSYIIGLLVIGFLQSCVPCENRRCPQDNLSKNLIITDGITGKNLLFGSFSTINPSQLRFFGTSQGRPEEFNYRAIKYNNSDSTLQVDFYPRPDQYVFIQLTPIDIDTIELSHTLDNDDCCGITNFITTIKYNGIISNTNNTNEPTILKKY